MWARPCGLHMNVWWVTTYNTLWWPGFPHYTGIYFGGCMSNLRWWPTHRSCDGMRLWTRMFTTWWSQYHESWPGETKNHAAVWPPGSKAAQLFVSCAILSKLTRSFYKYLWKRQLVPGAGLGTRDYMENTVAMLLTGMLWVSVSSYGKWGHESTHRVRLLEGIRQSNCAEPWEHPWPRWRAQ